MIDSSGSLTPSVAFGGAGFKMITRWPYKIKFTREYFSGTLIDARVDLCDVTHTLSLVTKAHSFRLFHTLFH